MVKYEIIHIFVTKNLKKIIKNRSKRRISTKKEAQKCYKAIVASINNYI